MGQILSEMQKKQQDAILQSINILVRSKMSFKNAFVLLFRSKEQMIEDSMLKTQGILRQKSKTIQRQEIGYVPLSLLISENSQITMEVILRKSNTKLQIKQFLIILCCFQIRIPSRQYPVLSLTAIAMRKIIMAGILIISKNLQLSSQSRCFSTPINIHQIQKAIVMGISKKYMQININVIVFRIIMILDYGVKYIFQNQDFQGWGRFYQSYICLQSFLGIGGDFQGFWGSFFGGSYWGSEDSDKDILLSQAQFGSIYSKLYTYQFLFFLNIPPICLSSLLYIYIQIHSQYIQYLSNVYIYLQSSLYYSVFTLKLYISKSINMPKFLTERVASLRSYVKIHIPGLFWKAEELQFKLATGGSDKKIAKIGNRVQLVRNTYPNLQQYLQMFYNSVSQNGRPNGQNLLFLTGMQGSGKTTLVKEALDVFRKRKSVVGSKNNRGQIGKDKEQNYQQFTTLSSPQYLEDLNRRENLSNPYYCILQFDFRYKEMMKPQAFFHHFETTIISKLLTLSTEIKQKQKQDLLSPDILVAIITAENDPEYMYMFVKDFVWAVINSCDRIHVGEKEKESLQSILNQITDVNAMEFFGVDNSGGKNMLEQKNSERKSGKGKKNKSRFLDIVHVIAKAQNVTELEAAFIVFLGAFKRIQYEHRPQLYLNREYQTSIQTTKFLFSVLNYICGFGALNKQTVRSYIQSASPTRTPSSPYHPPSFISVGNHIDTVLTLNHLHNISCFDHPKFQQWLDNVLIQLHNASNIRTHFPIILQIRDSYMLQKIQKCGRLEIDNPSVMEVPAYFQTNLYRYMPGLVVNPKVVQELRKVLGRNPKLWNQAFIELSKGTPLSDILQAKCQFMRKTKHRLQNRLNRLYLNPINLPLIDSNTLQMHILQYLKIISKCNGNMRTNFIFNNNQLLNNPTFSQLYEQNILYDSYYFLAVSLTDMRDLIQIREMLKIQNLGVKKWIQYFLWKRIQSPYYYLIRQLSYNDKTEIQMYKKLGVENENSDFMLREYYGEHRDYKVSLFSRVLKYRFNI